MSLETLSVVPALPEEAAPGRPGPSGRSLIWRAWPGSRARISLAAVALVLTLWQLSGSLRWIDPPLLPPPSDIWVAAQELLQSGYRQTPLWQHVAISAGRAVAAFLVAIVVGVPLGLGMGRWPTLAAAEMVAANAGLGWMVINAGTYLRTDVVLLGIVLLGLSGYLFDALLLLAQRRLVPWAGRDA